MDRLKPNLKLSAVVLILANLVPMVGVLTLGWNAFVLLLLFWLENVIIGFFNVLRMAVAQGGRSQDFSRKITWIIMFVLHFGLFTLVHGLVLFSIFSDASGLSGLGPGELFSATWAHVQDHQLGWAILALVVSRAVSFVTNTMLGGEFREMSLDKQMNRPYGRVIMMHLTVLLGAILVHVTGSGVWVLVVLVGVKIMVDLRSHQQERRLLSRSQPKTPSEVITAS